MGRIRRWAPRVVGIVVTVACLVGATRLLWPQPGLDEQPGSTARQLAFIRDALDEGSDTAAQQLFPEGYVFSNVLYGLAWVQAAHTDPELRADALRESRWALARVESDEGRAIFSPRLQPAYGVFWAGWTNWLRAAILSLDHSDTAAVQRFSTYSAELAQAFSAADTPFLEAYRGQAWPVDSTVAIASLRLHDKLFGAKYTMVIDRWLAQAEARLDPATGLLPHQVSPTDGSMLTGARATSQTAIHRFLPEIDPAFARSQYALFRDQFLAYPGGFGPAVREYPKGVDGSGDVDSGPLVAGISLSATVVAVGAARMNGDRALAAAIGSEGELIGLPVDLPWSKRYAFGLLPIGDAFVVWSSTARLLTEPPTTLGRELRWWWRLPWLSVLILIALAPWAWTLRRVGRTRATDPASSPPSPALLGGEGGGRTGSGAS